MLAPMFSFNGLLLRAAEADVGSCSVLNQNLAAIMLIIALNTNFCNRLQPGATVVA